MQLVRRCNALLGVAFEHLGIPFDTESRLSQWPFGRNYQSYYRPAAAGSNMAGSYPLGVTVDSVRPRCCIYGSVAYRPPGEPAIPKLQHVFCKQLDSIYYCYLLSPPLVSLLCLYSGYLCCPVAIQQHHLSERSEPADGCISIF
ncbi:hypothetical protein MRX96_008146 [Rhipicephalus microplus]